MVATRTSTGKHFSKFVSLVIEVSLPKTRPTTTEIAEMETVLWCQAEPEEMEEIIYILNTKEQFQNLNTKYLTI